MAENNKNKENIEKLSNLLIKSNQIEMASKLL